VQLLPQQFLKKSRDPDPSVPVGANVLVTLQLFVKMEVSRFSQSKYRLEMRSQNLKIRPLGRDLLGSFVIYRTISQKLKNHVLVIFRENSRKLHRVSKKEHFCFC